MTPEDAFVAARRRDWDELDHALGGGGPLSAHDGPTIGRVAALSRALASDLVRCRARRFSPELTAHLDQLAGRAHAALHGSQPLRLPHLARLVVHDFPAALRANGRLFALATALFVVPFGIGLLGAHGSADFAEAILPAAMLEQMADAYARGVDGGRAEGQDATMAGFYVANNVGIAFRCFATGALFGAGSLFFLVYNGLVIGTVVGHVMASGAGTAIWTFMAGHGPFEITAIWVSGAAGLELGYRMIVTHGRTRFGSVRAAAPSIVAQVVGAATMLVVAALIEGFWSPSGASNETKWVVGALASALVIAWLGLGGRGRFAPARSPWT